MEKSVEPEPDGSFSKWKIVCDKLGLTLAGDSMIELRRAAEKHINEKGDVKEDYHFQIFYNGAPTSSFVISPSQGLVNFQRGRARRAS